MSFHAKLRCTSIGVLLIAAAGMSLFPARAGAQSLSDYAAWDALMLSPAGALPPLERGDAGRLSRGWGFAARYGRWRYDIDDAIHNDAGFTVSHVVANVVDVSLTGAFLSLSCGTCSGWISGGIEARLPVATRLLSGAGDDPVTASLGLRGDLGTARYLGEGGAHARSLSASAALSLSVPAFLGGHLAFTVLPGVGGGRIVSVDENAQGTRPMIGATAAWIFPSGLAFHAGMQRVVISGGPSQLGLAMSWAGR